MQYRQNLPVLRLLIIVSVLAVAGGLMTVLVTSPQSFELVRLAFFQSTITPESTLPLTSTPTHTSVPATPTPGPTATSSHPPSVPSATSIPTAQQTSTRRPTATATATATGAVLPPDVRALAIVTGRVGSLIVRVRDLPNGAQVIAAIPGGTVLQVLFGQSVVDGIEWLQVRLASGRVGWIAGYLLTITIERPPGTGTTEAPGTQADTSTPVPATAPPNSTGQAPPGTAAPSQTGTAINPPVTPPATATNEATATLPPIPTEAPTAAATTVYRPPPTPTSANTL